jgi:hypothetical protein
MGSRLPVGETVPHASDDGVFPVEFGKGRAGHGKKAGKRKGRRAR